MTIPLPQATRIMNSRGFTLIELMLTLLISFFILGGIHQAHQTQQKSQTILSQRIEMQQQLRSLMTFLSSEIRLTGLDPLEKNKVGIEKISSGELQISIDKDEDGLAGGDNEDLEYGFTTTDDTDNDGQADTGAASFCRRRNNVDATEAGFETLAENIVAVEFLSTFDDTSDNGEYDPETSLSPAATKYEDIRAITISVLIRAKNQDTSFDNNSSYTAASGAVWGPYDDNYRRMLLTTTVQLRNIAL